MAEPKERAAFLGGYCMCLTNAVSFVSDPKGTSTAYVEAIRGLGIDGAEELLQWAKRNQDIEVPRIRTALRRLIERRDERRSERSGRQSKDGESNGYV